MEKVRSFFKKVIEIVVRPEMRILPGQLAFFFVISLIPLVALIGAICSSLSISLESFEVTLNQILPGNVGNILITAATNEGLNFNIGVFFISAFILASNGTNSIINVSNEIYKLKSKDFIRRRLKAIIMTFVLVILLVFILLVPVFGDSIFAILQQQLSNEKLITFLNNIYQLAKYPLSIIIIYFNIKLIYVIAPDECIESITTTKGAIFTTASWIIASELYSFYIETFAKYDIFYGSISNILILLLWVYLLSYIFVLGLVLNAGDYKNRNYITDEQ